MLIAEILIGCSILLEKTLNIKIIEILHLNVVLFAVISLDLKLICKVYEFLSGKRSPTTQVDE